MSTDILTDFALNPSTTIPTELPAITALRIPGSRGWQINKRLALVTLLVLAVLSPSLFVWHRTQVRWNATAILARAKTLNEQGDSKAATSAFHQYLQLRPEDPEALLFLAQTFDKLDGGLEHRQRAVSLYFQAVRANPKQSEARLRLADLLLETGRLDEAIQQARQAASELPGNVQAVRVLARALRTQLNASPKTSARDVIKFYRQALAQHRGDVVLSTGLADILRRFPNALPPEQRDSAASSANEVIDEMVEQYPADPEALLARFRYRAAFQLPGGLDDLENARLAAPENPDVLMASVLATADDDLAGAREFGERLLEVVPHSRRAYLTVAALYSRLQQPEEAIRVLETAVEKLGADDLELNRAMLQIHLAQQDTEQAEAALGQLEPLFQRRLPQLSTPVRRRFSEELEFARVQLQCLAGNTAAALPVLKRLAANVTESADATETLAERQRRWKLLAAVYAREGLHDQAAAAYDQLVRLDPRSRESHLLAATEWQRIGDFDRAGRHFELATAGEPNLPAAWLGLAETRLHQQLRKSPANSRDWVGFDAALKHLNGNHAELPPVLILRAVAALTRNDRAAALQSLKKLVAQPRLELAWLPRVAVLFQDAGAGSDAQASLERFRNSGGSPETAALTEAELQRRHGDFEAALRTLEQSLERSTVAGRGAILQQLISAEIDAGAIQAARQRLKGLRQTRFAELWAYEIAADLAVLAGDLDELRECGKQVETLEGPDGTLWRFVKSIHLLEAEQEGNDAVHQANRWAAEIEISRPTWPPLKLLRARISDRMGRTAEAVETYEQALRSGARNLATYQWLVSALQRLNRFGDASTLIGQSIQMAAVSDDLAAQAIPASLQAGRTSAALRIARTAAELRPGDAAAQVWYAQTLALDGKADAAETLLRKTLERFPQESRAWSALVWVLHRAERKAEARQTLDEMAARMPLDAHERDLVLARGFDMLGDDRAAEQSYRRALGGHDRDSQLLQEIGRFYLRIDHDKALATFQQALTINPKLVEARRTIAWLLGIRGSDAEWDQALTVLDDLDKTAIPDDRRLQAALLLVHGGTENIRKAAAVLADLVNKNDQPQTGDRLLLARAYELLNRPKDARRQFDAVLKVENAPAFRAQFVQFLVRQKQFDDALAQTLGASDGSDPAREASGILRILTIAANYGAPPSPRLTAAEQVLSSFRKSQPGHVAFLLELGVLRMMQGRTAEAVVLFEDVLKKTPKDPATLNNLALALAESPDRRNDALRVIDQALALLPDSIELLDSKSLILIGAGKSREAREILDPLCQTNGKNPRFRLHLAMALFQLKELNNSQSEAARALKDGLANELLTPSERHAWRQISNQVAGVTAK